MAFFVLTAAKDKILTTILNLRKEGIIIADWCCMPWACSESVDHMFLHFEFARELWCSVLSFLGVIWVMPRSVIAFLAYCIRHFGKNISFEIWKAISLCLLWSIWIFR